MTWTSIGANYTVDGSRDGVVAATAALARRFGARVIGMAAGQPANLNVGDGYGAGELVALEREAIEESLARSADAFARDFLTHDPETGSSWRGVVTYAAPARTLACWARAVDVVVTAPTEASRLGEGRRLNVAELIMAAGRPVLVVPQAGRPLGFGAMVVAWKDTCECRRAVADALPLLAQAQRVVLLEILDPAADDNGEACAAQVVTWLRRHGAPAERRLVRSRGNDADGLQRAAADLSADVLVAGAYGHSRLGEWVLGGVTCDYLLDPDRCVLLSR